MFLIILLILLVILCIVSCRYCKKKSSEYFLSTDFKEIIKKETNWVSLNSKNYQGIDSVYVITLPERLDYVNNITNELGIQANILDAFDKRNIDRIPKDFVVKDYDNNISGKAACQISHTQVLLHFLESDNETALILEDDVKLIKDRDSEKIGPFIKDVTKKDPDWSLIYLGYCYESTTSKEVESEIIKLLHPECTHAYVINKKAAKILLDNLYPMKRPVDTTMAKLTESGKFISYGPKNMFFGQNENMDSTIGNMKGAGNSQFK